MDWSEGYVTDVEYTRGYYRELNPLLQAFAIATSGGAAPNLEHPFVKVELGCGYGLSLLLEAAVFPHARFYGLDFNPRHIAWATRIAADAKLDNITFFDASFADLPNLAIPPADFVGMHGVWTWVNQDNRDIILRWLKHALADNGVTMVSYNSLGGWTELRGLRELMIRKYRSIGGPAEARVRSALEFAQNIANLGSPFFTQHPALIKAIEDLTKLPPRYLAHEYFNDNWHLFNHHDVAASMAETGSSFVASCKPVE
ncbi:MAG: methyltransferase domain-containing protein, partial [Rhodospirillaceae bacterium]|nr:methyltransferase domain-containing protein [Rhodospirillaceae bacterium]